MAIQLLLHFCTAGDGCSGLVAWKTLINVSVTEKEDFAGKRPSDAVQYIFIHEYKLPIIISLALVVYSVYS